MKYTYGISVTHTKAWAVTRIAISPNEAANLDREAFLAFAAEVEKVAELSTLSKVKDYLKALEEANLIQQEIGSRGIIVVGSKWVAPESA